MKASKELKPKPRAKLAEIAEAAGVSIATVSRVLNGEQRGSWKSTAQRAQQIRQIAARLGYHPDWRAKSLAGKALNTIGIVYSETHPMMDSSSYDKAFRAFSQIMVDAGYHMLFVQVSPDAAAPPHPILNGGVDGALFYHRLTPGSLAAIKSVSGPKLLFNIDTELPLPRIVPDDLGGAKAVTEHLLQLGHQRIAYASLVMGRPEFTHASRMLRYEVFRQVMTDAGLSRGALFWESDKTAKPIVDQYLALPLNERPTAIISAWCIEALYLLSEFIRRGIRIPQDLSLASSDDDPLIARAVVPLTAVAVPMPEMGQQAAQMLLAMLRGGEVSGAAPVVLPEQLIVRESTARPAHA